MYLKRFLAPVKKTKGRIERRPAEDPKVNLSRGEKIEAGGIFNLLSTDNTKDETCEISIATTQEEMKGPRLSMLTIAVGSTISVAIGTLAANHAVQKNNPAPTAEELQQTSDQVHAAVSTCL